MADLQLYSNFFETSLASGITDSATTATVLSGSGMNSPGANEYELLVIADGTNYEIVKCTARSINTLTIVRGQDGTSGTAFSTGAKVYGAVTAQTLSNFTRTDGFTVAASGEIGDLSTGTAKTTFRMQYALSLTEVRASVSEAPVGSVLTVDINEGGTTILSTKLTIDAGEKTSTTAAIPAVISDTELADDAEITIDIDTVGSTTPGKGLKVTFIGYRV